MSRVLPFVGRDQEEQALGALLNGVTQLRRARVALLTGEPGVGKSRILQEFLLRARRAGSQVVTARAYEVESGRPYGPWIDALRQIPSIAIGARLASELSVLVPEWAGEQPRRHSEEQLFGAVTELFAERAQSGAPVVIGIDDVHWLDEPSGRLLHYLARVHRQRPLAIVLTARAGELFDNAALTRLLRSLRREGLLQELEVGPMPRQDIEKLVSALSPERSVTRIFEESGGNPLFALEMARSSEALGTLPSKLSVLIRDRVEALPVPALDVLRWAALLGASVEVEHLELVTGLSPSELALALELLQRHAWLDTALDGPRPGAVYRFSHEIVRRAIYEELSEPRRRVMHRRAAECLEAALTRDESLAPEVVHHATLAGQPQLAALACWRAAQRCLRLFASKQAESLVRRGFYHAQQLPENQRVALELDLWRVQLEASSPSSVEQVGAELSRLGERALDLGLSEHARLAFQLLSWLRWEAGAGTEAIAFSLRAEQLSRSAKEEDRVHAMAESARCLALVERDLEGAEAMLLEARARAKRLELESVSIPDALGMLYWHRGELTEAAELFVEARQVARRSGDRINEFQALEHELCARMELGELDAARVVARALDDLAAKLRGGSEAPAAHALTALLRYLDTASEATEALEPALTALRAADAKRRLTYAQLLAAEADLKRGDAARAASRARDALANAHALSRQSDVVLARVTLANAAALLSDAAEHQNQLNALEALAPTRLSRRAQLALDGLSKKPSNTASKKNTAKRRTAWNSS